MDLMDVLRVGVPLAAFAIGVVLLLKFWPWGEAPFLNSREKVKAQIIDIVKLSPDTKRIRFSLGSRTTTLGLPVGKNIHVHAPNPQSCLQTGLWNGEPDQDKRREEVWRTYTPITGNETPGYMDLVVKVYRPGNAVKMADGSTVKWDNGGKVSQFLDSKQEGEHVEISGPVGLHEYLGRGTFKLPSKTVTVRHVGMLAGGTGITPMLQILRSSLQDRHDRCNFYLIYGNKTEEDILCKDIIEDLASSSKGRLKVIYTLNFPPAKWQHQKGHITRETMKFYLPKPSAETLILVCGPPPMVEQACKVDLEALSYARSMVVAL